MNKFISKNTLNEKELAVFSSYIKIKKNVNI